jgi:hypothetical protein
VLYTYGSNAATINGNVTITGGSIQLGYDYWWSICGQLNITGTLNMTGGTYYAKSSSQPLANDIITTTGNITLGGNAGLTAVSINLRDGQVLRNVIDTIMRTTGNNTMINGDFNAGNMNLGFGDGSGGAYTPRIDNGVTGTYELRS